jgi:aspartate/methionine/tyrosine aminotransferase
MQHQYTRSEGHVRLVHALAKFYSGPLNRQLNGLTEIMTTVGASEAIYSTIQAFVEPGDEVIIMQVLLNPSRISIPNQLVCSLFMTLILRRSP